MTMERTGAGFRQLGLQDLAKDRLIYKQSFKEELDSKIFRLGEVLLCLKDLK